MKKKDLLLKIKEGLFIGTFSVVMGGGVFSFAFAEANDDLEDFTIEMVANNDYVKDSTFYDELLSNDSAMAKDLRDLETAFRVLNILREHLISNDYKTVEICDLYLQNYFSDLNGELVRLHGLSEQEILELCSKAMNIKMVDGEYVLDDETKYANFAVMYLYNYYQKYLEDNAQSVMQMVAKSFLKSYKCYLDGKKNFSDYSNYFIKFGTPSDIKDSFCDGESAFISSDVDTSVSVLESGDSKEFYDVLRLLCYVQDNAYDSKNNEVVESYRLLMNKIKICMVSGCKYDEDNVIVPATSRVDIIRKVKKMN